MLIYETVLRTVFMQAGDLIVTCCDTYSDMTLVTVTGRKGAMIRKQLPPLATQSENDALAAKYHRKGAVRSLERLAGEPSEQALTIAVRHTAQSDAVDCRTVSNYHATDIKG